MGHEISYETMEHILDVPQKHCDIQFLHRNKDDSSKKSLAVWTHCTLRR